MNLEISGADALALELQNYPITKRGRKYFVKDTLLLNRANKRLKELIKNSDKSILGQDY